MSRYTARARSGSGRTSLYDEITDKIVAELEAGRVPWVQPWGTAATGSPLGMPKNAATGRRYSGINVLILRKGGGGSGSGERSLPIASSVRRLRRFRPAQRQAGHVAQAFRLRAIEPDRPIAVASGAETVGEFRKSVDHDIGRGVGYGIGRAGGSPLVGSAHEGGAIADAASRIEVEIVARHHQDFVRLDGQKRGGAPIGIGERLVDAQHLAGDHGVPIDAVAA